MNPGNLGCYWQLLSSADELSKQLGSRTKPFHTLGVFVRELFEKGNFEKKLAEDNKSMNIIQHAKS